MINAVNWFEIPTTNLDRAVTFYETMLATRLRREVFGGTPHAVFRGDKDGAGGALIQDARRKPSQEGTLVYLNANKDLDGCVKRATGAGGRIVLPKTDIGDPGFIAIVADTEGNHVALHMERQAAGG
jgi:predicted enzyme related to lactoylglutathione lyase